MKSRLFEKTLRESTPSDKALSLFDSIETMRDELKALEERSGSQDEWDELNSRIEDGEAKLERCGYKIVRVAGGPAKLTGGPVTRSRPKRDPLAAIAERYHIDQAQMDQLLGEYGDAATVKQYIRDNSSGGVFYG
jgi:hypothetical protein